MCVFNPACVFLQGIVSLCLQFECLLQTYLPQLFYHLRQLGAQPWVHAAPSSCLQLVLHPVVWQFYLPFKMLFTSTMSVIVWALTHFSWLITPVFSWCYAPILWREIVNTFPCTQVINFSSKSFFTYCLLLFVSFCRLRIAFKWIVRAFSGYLSTDQLLILWDRILGYDSLEIVAGTCRHVFYAPSSFLSFYLTPSSSSVVSSPRSSCVCLPGWKPDGGHIIVLSWGTSDLKPLQRFFQALPI